MRITNNGIFTVGFMIGAFITGLFVVIEIIEKGRAQSVINNYMMCVIYGLVVGIFVGKFYKGGK